MTDISKDSVTDDGEPIIYLNTPDPEISSSIVTIPSGMTTEWMTHPVQGYVYVLEGTLIVEFADGPRKVFEAGKGFPQARSKWHRGRNDGERVVRSLAVFFGGKDVPNVPNPPKAHQDPCPDVAQTRLQFRGDLVMGRVVFLHTPRPQRQKGFRQGKPR
jgi:quercetin dioxygenase-like cupin family protein